VQLIAAGAISAWRKQSESKTNNESTSEDEDNGDE
jgi:hypothetical protein